MLVTGASGFIGRRLVAALAAAGHEVVCAVRNPAAFARREPRVTSIAADFTTDHDPAIWMPRVAGMDAVVNAVGILREAAGQTFELIHVIAPRALFEACRRARVGRVLQISALGADEHARSAYHLSKRRADEFLASLPLDWTIVQPSLVYGAEGTSARLFTTLASLPVVPLPGRGEQQVQPIHIDDAVEAIVRALSSDIARRSRVALVGPSPLSLREFLSRLRLRLGLGRARFLAVPIGFVRALARLARRLPGLLDPDTLEMLIRGNTADAAAVERLLGRPPRDVESFIADHEVPLTRLAARLAIWLPMLRLSIAIVWIVTGIVSLGVYPREASYALLGQVGIPAVLGPALLAGAGIVDLLFGLATLLLRERRLLWLLQIAAILFYTVVITVWLPGFWAHPFGPLTKNLPMLAAIGLLYALERRPWNT